MFFPSKKDIEFLKRIYNYITPVIVTYEKIQNKRNDEEEEEEQEREQQHNDNVDNEDEDDIKDEGENDDDDNEDEDDVNNEDINDDDEVIKKVFELIKNMRDTACIYILKGNFIKPLFVNMVKLYKYFQLNLVSKFIFVKELWSSIPENDRKFTICKYDESTKKSEIIDYEFPDVKNDCKRFYCQFKELLKCLYMSREKCEILDNFPKGSISKIKTVYKHVAPIILWYEFVDEKFREDNKNDLFFKVNLDTKFCLENFLEKVVNENILKQIMENIRIIYLAFGIDLYKSRENVKSLLQAEPNKYRFVKENLYFDDESKSTEMGAKDIISKIRNILCNKNDPLNEKYFLYGQMLHHLVSTKITNNEIITQVFLNNENMIKWSNEKNRFIKDSENNLNRKKIFKLSSPFFVWIEVVNKLESTEYEEKFYSKINFIRNKIINYLKTKIYNAKLENDIVNEMNNFYKPIEEYLNTNGTLCNYAESNDCRDIFNKLALYSVISRKHQGFSHSYIFQYCCGLNEISIDMDQELKLFDILNFFGIFYLFESFKNNSTISKDSYRNIKEITNKITEYMKQEIERKLEDKIEIDNKIIVKIKSVLPQITDKITDYLIEERKRKYENTIELEKKIIDDIKSVLPQITDNITDYLIEERKRKYEDPIELVKKIIDEIKLEKHQITDRITDCTIKEIQETLEDNRDLKNQISNEMKLIFDETIDGITSNMIPKININDLKIEIIHAIKFVLPNYPIFVSIDYDDFPEVFSQIYSILVKSNAHV